jgi:hypothetical protein
MRGEDLARWTWWLGLGLIISLAVPGIIWGRELVLYDRFERPRIEPDKWFGSETRRPSAILEASRFVKGGKLYLIAVGYGDAGSNAGRQTGSFGLGVKTPRSITALQAELTVTNVMAQTCAANAESTQARAQLVGFFFNDGSGSQREKGDLTGDVVAVLEKVADSRDGHFLRAIVLRCTSWTCSQGQTIKAFIFQRKWTLSEPDVLRIEWEASKSQFVFSVNPGVEGEETRRIAYGPALQPHPPSQRQLQRIRVRHHGANCQAGRRAALMTVAVDEVYVRFPGPQATQAGAAESATAEDVAEW